MQNEKVYIEKCCALIEEKIAWGSSKQWQNQDFEALSERIFTETNVTLSSITLKRIWGKVRYDSSPNLATLNALAQFVGYENWRIFTTKHTQEPNTDKVTGVLTSKSTISIFPKVWWVIGIGVVLVFGGMLVFPKMIKPLHLETIVFKSMPVTLGVPNTVVFEYDASQTNADSVFIQQSWDPQKRDKVDKTKHEYTSIYYWPGYYRAKLVLNDSIVKEHDVYIETDGWLGTIDKDSIPIYLSKTQIYKNNILGISEEDLKAYQIDFQKNTPSVSLFKVDKTKTFPSNNFKLEAELRNTYGKGNGVCQQTQIVLLCTGGIHIIPLSIKGCVGELDLILGNQTIEGKTKDLSGFGVDFNNWVNVKMEVKNGLTQMFVNNELAYQGSFKENIGQIIGTRIRFTGTGSVKKFELSKW